MERTGIEPVTSGLQTQPTARPPPDADRQDGHDWGEFGHCVERHPTPLYGGPLAPRSHGRCL